MEQQTQYMIMKLRSGEEIIARIIENTEEKLTLERPMCFRSILTQDYYGTPKEILLMKNWIPLSTEKTIDIPKNHVISFINPNKDAVLLYQTEKEKEDKREQTSKFVKESMDMNADEEFKKMMKFLSDNTQKLDDMMMKDQPEDKTSIPEKGKKDDMIYMNMMFPPEMLVDLIESDIIDPEIFGEMYQDIKRSRKKKKAEPPKAKKKPTKGNLEGTSQKYTGEEKDHKDYGNRWTDWNPDLKSEDYQ